MKHLETLLRWIQSDSSKTKQEGLKGLQEYLLNSTTELTRIHLEKIILAMIACIDGESLKLSHRTHGRQKKKQVELPLFICTYFQRIIQLSIIKWCHLGYYLKYVKNSLILTSVYTPLIQHIVHSLHSNHLIKQSYHFVSAYLQLLSLLCLTPKTISLFPVEHLPDIIKLIFQTVPNQVTNGNKQPLSLGQRIRTITVIYKHALYIDLYKLGFAIITKLSNDVISFERDIQTTYTNSSDDFNSMSVCLYELIIKHQFHFGSWLFQRPRFWKCLFILIQAWNQLSELSQLYLIDTCRLILAFIQTPVPLYIKESFYTRRFCQGILIGPGKHIITHFQQFLPLTIHQFLNDLSYPFLEQESKDNSSLPINDIQLSNNFLNSSVCFLLYHPLLTIPLKNNQLIRLPLSTQHTLIIKSLDFFSDIILDQELFNYNPLLFEHHCSNMDSFNHLWNRLHEGYNDQTKCLFWLALSARLFEKMIARQILHQPIAIQSNSYSSPSVIDNISFNMLIQGWCLKLETLLQAQDESKQLLHSFNTLHQSSAIVGRLQYHEKKTQKEIMWISLAVAMGLRWISLNDTQTVDIFYDQTQQLKQESLQYSLITCFPFVINVHKRSHVILDIKSMDILKRLFCVLLKKSVDYPVYSRIDHTFIFKHDHYTDVIPYNNLSQEVSYHLACLLLQLIMFIPQESIQHIVKKEMTSHCENSSRRIELNDINNNSFKSTETLQNNLYLLQQDTLWTCLIVNLIRGTRLRLQLSSAFLSYLINSKIILSHTAYHVCRLFCLMTCLPETLTNYMVLEPFHLIAAKTEYQLAYLQDTLSPRWNHLPYFSPYKPSTPLSTTLSIPIQLTQTLKHHFTNRITQIITDIPIYFIALEDPLYPTTLCFETTHDRISQFIIDALHYASLLLLSFSNDQIKNEYLTKPLTTPSTHKSHVNVSNSHYLYQLYTVYSLICHLEQCPILLCIVFIIELILIDQSSTLYVPTLYSEDGFNNENHRVLDTENITHLSDDLFNRVDKTHDSATMITSPITFDIRYKQLIHRLLLQFFNQLSDRQLLSLILDYTQTLGDRLFRYIFSEFINQLDKSGIGCIPHTIKTVSHEMTSPETEVSSLTDTEHDDDFEDMGQSSRKRMRVDQTNDRTIGVKLVCGENDNYVNFSFNHAMTDTHVGLLKTSNTVLDIANNVHLNLCEDSQTHADINHKDPIDQMFHSNDDLLHSSSWTTDSFFNTPICIPINNKYGDIYSSEESFRFCVNYTKHLNPLLEGMIQIWFSLTIHDNTNNRFNQLIQYLTSIQCEYCLIIKKLILRGCLKKVELIRSSLHCESRLSSFCKIISSTCSLLCLPVYLPLNNWNTSLLEIENGLNLWSTLIYHVLIVPSNITEHSRLSILKAIFTTDIWNQTTQSVKKDIPIILQFLEHVFNLGIKIITARFVGMTQGILCQLFYLIKQSIISTASNCLLKYWKLLEPSIESEFLKILTIYLQNIVMIKHIYFDISKHEFLLLLSNYSLPYIFKTVNITTVLPLMTESVTILRDFIFSTDCIGPRFIETAQTFNFNTEIDLPRLSTFFSFQPSKKNHVPDLISKLWISAWLPIHSFLIWNYLSIISTFVPSQQSIAINILLDVWEGVNLFTTILVQTINESTVENDSFSDKEKEHLTIPLFIKSQLHSILLYYFDQMSLSPISNGTNDISVGTDQINFQKTVSNWNSLFLNAAICRSTHSSSIVDTLFKTYSLEFLDLYSSLSRFQHLPYLFDSIYTIYKDYPQLLAAVAIVHGAEPVNVLDYNYRDNSILSKSTSHNTMQCLLPGIIIGMILRATEDTNQITVLRHFIRYTLSEKKCSFKNQAINHLDNEQSLSIDPLEYFLCFLRLNSWNFLSPMRSITFNQCFHRLTVIIYELIKPFNYCNDTDINDNFPDALHYLFQPLRLSLFLVSLKQLTKHPNSNNNTILIQTLKWFFSVFPFHSVMKPNDISDALVNSYCQDTASFQILYCTSLQVIQQMLCHPKSYTVKDALSLVDKVGIAIDKLSVESGTYLLNGSNIGTIKTKHAVFSQSLYWPLGELFGNLIIINKYDSSTQEEYNQFNAEEPTKITPFILPVDTTISYDTISPIIQHVWNQIGAKLFTKQLSLRLTPDKVSNESQQRIQDDSYRGLLSLSHYEIIFLFPSLLSLLHSFKHKHQIVWFLQYFATQIVIIIETQFKITTTLNKRQPLLTQNEIYHLLKITLRQQKLSTPFINIFQYSYLHELFLWLLPFYHSITKAENHCKRHSVTSMIEHLNLEIFRLASNLLTDPIPSYSVPCKYLQNDVKMIYYKTRLLKQITRMGMIFSIKGILQLRSGIICLQPWCQQFQTKIIFQLLSSALKIYYRTLKTPLQKKRTFTSLVLKHQTNCLDDINLHILKVNHGLSAVSISTELLCYILIVSKLHLPECLSCDMFLIQWLLHQDINRTSTLSVLSELGGIICAEWWNCILHTIKENAHEKNSASLIPLNQHLNSCFNCQRICRPTGDLLSNTTNCTLFFQSLWSSTSDSFYGILKWNYIPYTSRLTLAFLIFIETTCGNHNLFKKEKYDIISMLIYRHDIFCSMILPLLLFNGILLPKDQHQIHISIGQFINILMSTYIDLPINIQMLISPAIRMFLSALCILRSFQCTVLEKRPSPDQTIIHCTNPIIFNVESPISIACHSMWSEINFQYLANISFISKFPAASHLFSHLHFQQLKLSPYTILHHHSYGSQHLSNQTQTPASDVSLLIASLHSLEVGLQDAFYGTLAPWTQRSVLSIEAEAYGTYSRQLALSGFNYFSNDNLSKNNVLHLLNSNHPMSSKWKWHYPFWDIYETTEPTLFGNESFTLNLTDNMLERREEIRFEWLWRMRDWTTVDTTYSLFYNKEDMDYHQTIAQNQTNLKNYLTQIYSITQSQANLKQIESTFIQNDCHHIIKHLPITTVFHNEFSELNNHLIDLQLLIHKNNASNNSNPKSLIITLTQQFILESFQSILVHLNTPNLQLYQLCDQWMYELHELCGVPSLLDIFEPVIAFRHSMLKLIHSVKHINNLKLGVSIMKYKLEICRTFRLQNLQDIALIKSLEIFEQTSTLSNTVSSLSSTVSQSDYIQELSFLAEWELMKGLWESGESQRALLRIPPFALRLRQMTSGSFIPDLSIHIACCLSSMGRWLFDSHWETFEKIEHDYFLPAIELSRSVQKQHEFNSLEILSIECCHPQSIFLPHREYATLVDDILQHQDDCQFTKESAVVESLEKSSETELELLQNEMGRLSRLKTKQSEQVIKVLQEEVCRLNDTLKKKNNIKKEQKNKIIQLAVKAISHYCLWLGSVATHGHEALRVTSRVLTLWVNFGSESHRVNEVVHQAIQPFFGSNTSYKKKINTQLLGHLKQFIYQIGSRIGCQEADTQVNSFQNSLQKILKLLLLTFPFQSIFPLLLLRNGDLVPDDHHGQDRFVYQASRIETSKQLLMETAADIGYDPFGIFRLLLEASDTLSAFFIHLGNLQTHSKSIDTLNITRLPNYQGMIKASVILPIPTATPVDAPNFDISSCTTLIQENGTKLKQSKKSICNYIQTYIQDHLYIPTISHFDQEITMTANGITRPKIVCVWDNTGVKHKQIVKGRDDLRQDAVMEQLFCMLNKVFNSIPKTRDRQLRIRVYQVVPLSPVVGIVQWVTGTMTIGDFLVGTSSDGLPGAHERYFPNDLKHSEARQKLQNVRTQYCSNRKSIDSSTILNTILLTTYQEICKAFHPVMNCALQEIFSLPQDWIVALQRYNTSLAVTSMCGYLMGIGDRHTNNILLDISNGELIHIDFGVVFERGKTLGIPEVVPFRLTRDCVAGLGPMRFQGPFRKNCEVTLEVLREITTLIIPVIEVFLFDPLYLWALNSRKAIEMKSKQLLQTHPADITLNASGNLIAKQALLQVRKKLVGVASLEDTLPDYTFLSSNIGLPVSSVVDRLLRQATSEENLAVMFAGWSPWV